MPSHGLGGDRTSSDAERAIVETQTRLILEELQRAKQAALTANMDVLRRRFDRVRVMMQSSRLPIEVTQGIRETVRTIEIAGLQKLTDLLLKRATEEARKDNPAARDEAIKEARVHMSRAKTLGASREFQEVSGRKIEVALMTSSQNAAGIPKPVPGTARSTAPAPVQATTRPEQRRFKRFTRPLLVVTIEERSFRTLNWSIGGVALDQDWPPGWEGREDLRLRITAESDDAVFVETGRFLRSFGDRRGAAVQFKGVHTQALKIVQRLTARGRVPTE